jgi:hypothetical protein
MSVRNDQELPRPQADASDDAYTWTDQGPLEVQEDGGDRDGPPQPGQEEVTTAWLLRGPYRPLFAH